MIVAGNYLVKMRSSFSDEENVKRLVQLPRKEKPLEPDFKQARFKKRLADAKVVIPPAFTAVKTTPEARAASSPLENTGRIGNYKHIVAAHKAGLARLRCAELTALKKEFCKYGADYAADHAAALKSAEDDHEAATTAAVNDYLDRHPDLKELIDTNGGWKEGFNAEELFPESIFPPFEFDFPLPFSKAYRGFDSLSQAARDYIGSCKYENATVALVLDALDMEQRQCAKAAQAKGRKAPKSALINGVPVKMGTLDRFDYTLSLKEGAKGEQALYMSLFVNHDGAYLKGAEYALTLDVEASAANGVTVSPGAPLEGTAMAIVHRAKGLLLLELFPDQALSIPAGAVVRLEGTLESGNGAQLTFERTGILTGNWLCGTASRVPAGGDDGPVHYGINSIGVVDYRRVEQELCCYIPGEVSHIENIMAKSTRRRAPATWSARRTPRNSPPRTRWRA